MTGDTGLVNLALEWLDLWRPVHAYCLQIDALRAHVKVFYMLQVIGRADPDPIPSIGIERRTG